MLLLGCSCFGGGRFPEVLALADWRTMTHFPAMVADVSFVVPVCLCVVHASAPITFPISPS